MSAKKLRLILILVVCFVTLAGLFARFLVRNSDPFRNFHSVINLANIVVIRSVHPTTGNTRLTQILTDPQDVAYLNSMLEFAPEPEQSWQNDASYGYVLLEWRQNERLVTLATVHSGGIIRWQGFRGDARLTSEAAKSLESWLALGGIEPPAAQAETTAPPPADGLAPADTSAPAVVPATNN